MFEPQAVYAQCPVCVVTVGGGLFLAKKFGIDDLLTALWISGLNTALSFWMASYFKKSLLRSGVLWSIVLFVSTWGYLAYTKQMYLIRNTLFGIDKTLLGLISGYVVWFGGILVNQRLKRMNGGKVYFPYQKVVIPLVGLMLMTILYWILVTNIRS